MNFRAPYLINDSNDGVAVIHARDVRMEGRKLYLEAELTGPKVLPGEGGAVTYAEAESLFVRPRDLQVQTP